MQSNETYSCCKSAKVTAAHAEAHRLLLQEVVRVHRARRALASSGTVPLTGVAALAALTRGASSAYEGGSGVRQVLLCAHLLAEPADDRCASALDLVAPS